MKVTLVDSKLRKHVVDVDASASVAEVASLLELMSLVPAGRSPKLVYQRRILTGQDSLRSIGYSPDRIISVVCIRAPSVSKTSVDAAKSDFLSKAASNPMGNAPNAPAAFIATPATADAAIAPDTYSVDMYSCDICAHRIAARCAGLSCSVCDMDVCSRCFGRRTEPLGALYPARPDIFSMGFDEVLVQSALAKTNGNEERAVDILISGQLVLDEPSSANTLSSPATRHVIFSMGFDEELVQHALVSAGGNEEQAVDLLIHGRVSATASSVGQPASSTAPAPRASPAPPPAPAPAPGAPVLNFATEWMCERGLIWPKAVDYITQCPKGHTLKACSALPRCHVCSEAGRGSGASCVQACIYGVCSACLAALRQPRTAVASFTGGGAFPSLGVSPEFLQAFKTTWGEVIRGWTTSQVCNQLIKTLTCRSRGSACDDLLAAGSTLVGEANMFLSHTWGNLFLDSVDACLGAVENSGSVVKTFVWFDVFSTSQHSASDRPSSWWMSVFREAIAKMGRLAMVLQPWNDPLALKRAWYDGSARCRDLFVADSGVFVVCRCVLELHSCAASGGKFQVAMTPSERDRFAHEIRLDPGAFNTMLSKVNTRNAQCSRHEDRVSLLIHFTTVAMVFDVVVFGVVVFGVGLASAAIIMVK